MVLIRSHHKGPLKSSLSLTRFKGPVAYPPPPIFKASDVRISVEDIGLCKVWDLQT